MFIIEQAFHHDERDLQALVNAFWIDVQMITGVQPTAQLQDAWDDAVFRVFELPEEDFQALLGFALALSQDEEQRIMLADAHSWFER